MKQREEDLTVEATGENGYRRRSNERM